MAKKKLLVLSGADAHRFLVKTAKEMGLYTIVTDYLPPERSPAKLIADECWDISIVDVDAIVERCRAEGVDAVLGPCADPAQRPYQEICEQLGLPCYGTKEQFYTLSNKKAFKAFCRECGVDVIPDYTLEECRNGMVQYPVFVKPTDSRGSRGQTICYCFEEVEKAVEIAARESNTGDYLIEKYLAGKQVVSLMFLVCGGKAQLICALDVHCGKEDDGLSRQPMIGIAPSFYSKLISDYAQERIEAMIRKAGIQNGPVFMQGFVDGGAIRMFDPGLRFSGAEYAEPFYVATGINLMEILIEFALGQNISVHGATLKNSYRLNGKHMVKVHCYLSAGTVASVAGIEEIKNYRGVLQVAQRIFAGDTVQATGDIRQRAFSVCFVTDSHSGDIRNTIDYIWDTIRYVDIDNRPMNITFDVRDICKLYE